MRRAYGRRIYTSGARRRWGWGGAFLAAVLAVAMSMFTSSLALAADEDPADYLHPDGPDQPEGVHCVPPEHKGVFVNATEPERAEFVERWLPRLRRQAADFDLDFWTNGAFELMHDKALEPLLGPTPNTFREVLGLLSVELNDPGVVPAPVLAQINKVPPGILDEIGFNDETRDLPTRKCLIRRLRDTLGPDYGTTPVGDANEQVEPPRPITADEAGALLYMAVFGHDGGMPGYEEEESPAPGPFDEYTDPVNDLLNSLGLNLPVGLNLPTINTPDLSSILTTIDAIRALLPRIVLPNLPLPNLGTLVNGLPIKLPNLGDIPLPSVDEIVDQVRDLVDAASYQVCVRSQKRPRTICSGKLPIGVPYAFDAIGTDLPDGRAQLLPFVNPAAPTGLTMRFSVDSLPSSTNPTAPAPLLPANVVAVYSVPTGGIQVIGGFMGLDTNLARSSVATFTLTDPVKAAQGDVEILANATQTGGLPDHNGLMIATTKLIRTQSGSATASPTAKEPTVGFLDFAPVPRTIDARIRMLQNEGGVKGSDHYWATVTPSVQSKVTADIVSAGIPKELNATNTDPCCGIRWIHAVIDQLPRTATVDLSTTRDRTKAIYTASDPINDLDVVVSTYEDGERLYPTAAEQKNREVIKAHVTQVPQRVEVDAKPISETTPKVVDVSYKGSDNRNPETLVQVPQVDVCIESRHDRGGVITGGTPDDGDGVDECGEQKAGDGDVEQAISTTAHDVPGTIKVTGTLDGTAFATPAGDDLTADFVYDASSDVKDITLDFFDRNENGKETRLHGFIQGLPRFIRTHIASSAEGLLGSEKKSLNVSYDGRTAADAPEGSAAIGSAFTQFAQNAGYLPAGDRPTSEAYAIIHQTLGADPAEGADIDDTLMAEVKYDGLKLAKISTASDEPAGTSALSATVTNATPKRLEVQLETPEQKGSIAVNKVPDSVTVSQTGQRVGQSACGATAAEKKRDAPQNQLFKYRGSAPIDSVEVHLQGKSTLSQPSNDEFFADVYVGKNLDGSGTGVPTEVDVDAQLASKFIDYTANNTISRVSASMGSATKDDQFACKERVLAASATATDVPQAWKLAFGSDVTTFGDRSGNPLAGNGLGSLAATFTNREDEKLPTSSAPYRIMAWTDARTGDLAANVSLAGVRFFKLTSGGTTHMTANLAGDANRTALGGQAAEVGLSLVTNSGTAAVPNYQLAQVEGTVGNVADELQLDLTDPIANLDGAATRVAQVHIKASRTMDPDLVIGLGDPAAVHGTARPPKIRGVSLRDGCAAGAATCAKPATKVGVELQGAPTEFTVTPDLFTSKLEANAHLLPLDIVGFDPPAANRSIGADIAATHASDLGKHIVAGVNITLKPAGAFSLKLQPIIANDTNPFKIHYEANDNLAALTFSVRTGTNREGTCGACGIGAEVTVRNLPKVLDANVSTQKIDAQRKKTVIFVRQQSAPNLDDSAAKIDELTAKVSVAPNVLGTPKIQATIKDLPTRVTIDMLDGELYQELTKAGACQPDRRLPSIRYDGEGTHAAGVDLEGAVDFTVLNDIDNLDPNKPVKNDRQPKIFVGGTDLSETMTFNNTDTGFHITNGGGNNARLNRLHLGITNLDLTLMDWMWDTGECSPPSGAFRLKGGLLLQMESIGIGLTMTGVRDAHVSPGLFTSAYGDLDTLDIGLYNMNLRYELGLGLSVRGSVAGVNFEIPIVPTIRNHLGPAPMILVMDKQENRLNNWLGIPTPVPCRIASLDPPRGPQVFHLGITRRPASMQIPEVNRMSFSAAENSDAGFKWRAVPWILDPLGTPLGTAFNAVIHVLDFIVGFEAGLPDVGPKFGFGFTCPG